MYDVYQFKNKNMQIWRYEGEIKKLLRYDVRNLKGSVCVRALIFKIFVYHIIFTRVGHIYFILHTYILYVYIYEGRTYIKYILF